MMFSSIRVRLIFSHLAVIALAMGLSALLLLSFLGHYFLQATEASLMAQGRITAQALIPGAMVDALPAEVPPAYNTIQQQQVSSLNLQTENLMLPVDNSSSGDLDLTYLADASLRLGAQLETRIRILDAQGIVLVDSWQTDTGMDLRGTPLFMETLSGKPGSQTTYEDGGAVLEVMLPVTVEEQRVGIVYLSQPLSDVAAVLQDLRARLLLSTTIAVVFSGIAGLLLSQAITSPLRKLTAAVRAVAQGNLDQQVPIHTRDELGHLSRTFNDMTTRLRAARQLQTDFVANVSHELRTPLTSVKSIVETLRDGAVEDPGVRDPFLDLLENETNRLIRLVNDLLLLSRADSEALNLHCEAVSLVELVQTTMNQLSPQAGQKLVLEVAASANGVCAWVDADRVAQVLVNLLDNALKYSPPDGTVTIRLDSDSEKFMRVKVRDEGIGIAAADLPYIGQRFYRADKARSRASGGSGLGLAIARALVQAHGGQLWLESQEGDGTVVSFTLPVP